MNFLPFLRSFADMKPEKSSNPVKFVAQSILNEDRIDCRYYDPEYFQTINTLHEISKSKGFDLVPLAKLLNDGKRSLTGGATPLGATYLEKGVPFIRSQNVKETGIEVSETVFIAKALHEGKFKRSQLKPGDVLLTITGAIYGIAATVPDDIGQANINQHIVRIHVNKEEVLPEFLSLILNSKFGKNQTDRAVTGGTRPALDYGSIRRLQILRPSIPFQQKLVEEARQVYQEAKEIRSQIANLEESYDSIILDKLAISIPEEPKLKTFLSSIEKLDRFDVKWHCPYHTEIIKLLSNAPSRKLGQFHHDLKYGASLYADYVSDIPFLRIENLRRNYVDRSDLQYISSAVHKAEVANMYLQKDDILIARSGATLGICSYVPQGMENHVYGSYIIRLRLKEEPILPRYLSAYLNSILGRLQFERVKTGSAQYNVSLDQIREITIIEPDPDVQEDISSAVFDFIGQLAELRKLHQEKLDQAKSRFIKNLTS
jgi:restriction endonuclease S subunit